jgi:S-adenosylmethionine hydrolase
MDEATPVYTIGNRNFMLPSISSTFHGRDVFSPAAAHLALGQPPSAFGRHIHDPVRLPDLCPKMEGGLLRGKVVRFDRFGNAITNISSDALYGFLKRRPFSVEVGAISFNRISDTYYENDVTCLFSSASYLEFGYFKGSFKAEKGLSKGDEVRVRLL